VADSGGMRGMRPHTLLTGLVHFCNFNFCHIVNWIFGHRIIPCVPVWVQKQNTEHALMTEADTHRSLQLVLDQSHGTPIWRAAMLTNQYVFHALLPAVEMTAPDAYTACSASMYPNLSILLQVLVTLPVTTATPERSFSTLKRLKTYLRNLPSSMEDEWLRSLALLACSTYMRKRRQSNLSKSLTSSLYWTTQA